MDARAVLGPCCCLRCGAPLRTPLDAQLHSDWGQRPSPYQRMIEAMETIPSRTEIAGLGLIPGWEPTHG